MVEIQNTLVSLDIFSEYFCCDLEACHGACCIEGDAGAPVTIEEVEGLEASYEELHDELTRAARKVVDAQGVVYPDRDGELVTSIVNGRDCVFTCYSGGCCYCTIDRAFRDGRSKHQKPISCALYPIRLSRVADSVALNYNRWDVCKPARILGSKLKLPLYKFLREPLIRRFGQEWYDECEVVAEELRKAGYI